MGKMAAYLGPPTRIAALVEEGPQSLVHHAVDSTDGFGFGWYPDDDDPEPVTVASRMPMRADDGLMKLARRFRSRCFLAGTRHARPNEAIELSGCQPFQHGPFLFHHEGELSRFREVFERPLRSRLNDQTYRLLKGPTCSELLFATWVDALGERRGADAVANALESMVSIVREIALSAGASVTLAIVVSDGSSLVTLRTATDGSPPAMYTIVAEEGAPVPPTARVIASEPLFKGSWTALDPHSLIIFTTD